MSNRDSISQYGDATTRILDLIRYYSGEKDWPVGIFDIKQKDIDNLEEDAVDSTDLSRNVLSKSLKDGTFHTWPPDVFAVALAVLRHSTQYLHVIESWPPDEIKFLGESINLKDLADEYQENKPTGYKEFPPVGKKVSLLDAWRMFVFQEAAKWRDHINSADKTRVKEKGKEDNLPCYVEPTDMLNVAWRTIEANCNVCIRNLCTNNHCEVIDALIFLVALSDETSESIGVRSGIENSKYHDWADRILARAGSSNSNNSDQRSTTLCRYVNNSKAIVLPKMRTPQSSITVRSMSHHLSLIRGGEVVPVWQEIQVEETNQFAESLTLLLMPYPWKVLPSQFIYLPEDDAEEHYRRLSGTNRKFFKFRPSDSTLSEEKLISILDAAAKEVENIDGVIFPEMALDEADANNIYNKILGSTWPQARRRAKFVIAGVVKHGKERAEYSSNYAEFRANHFDDEFEKIVQKGGKQHKHHRWHLDSRQLNYYRLEAGRFT